jgi:hypothetical protein
MVMFLCGSGQYPIVRRSLLWHIGGYLCEGMGETQGQPSDLGPKEGPLTSRV